MAVDLTGGLPASRDYMLPERPEDPDLRESCSMWIFDDQGAIALPRVGIEALASRWEQRDVQINLGFVDGRLILVRAQAEDVSSVDDEGIARSFRAGGLEFRCDEPFLKWTLLYDGAAIDTTVDSQLRGETDAKRIHLKIEVETAMATPPFVQGTLVKTARDALAEGVEGQFMGGDRYEQLFTATGTVGLGDEEISFTGSGLRIHRQGARNTAGFWGHCWQSALFPGGRGFGYIAFPPRADGAMSYNEGFIYSDGRLEAAQVLHAPWMTRLRPSGEDVSLVLGTDSGEVHIDGELILSSIMPGGSPQSELVKLQGGFDLALQQGGVHYRWDGEESYGMIERSSPADQLIT